MSKIYCIQNLSFNSKFANLSYPDRLKKLSKLKAKVHPGSLPGLIQVRNVRWEKLAKFTVSKSCHSEGKLKAKVDPGRLPRSVMILVKGGHSRKFFLLFFTFPSSSHAWFRQIQPSGKNRQDSTFALALWWDLFQGCTNQIHTLIMVDSTMKFCMGSGIVQNSWMM